VKRKILLVLLVAAVLGAVGAAGWHFTREGSPGGNALTLYGNVDIRQVQLAFNGSERIATMVAREGDPVKKGQLLATLDTVRLENNVKLQQAQLAAQQQQVARLEAGSRPEEILKAQADVDAAFIAADNARQTYLRQKDLVARHFVAQQQADDALAAADAAQARFQSLQETLKLVRMGPRKEDIAAARAMMKASQAALDVARNALADASLYAPENGIIQERILEPGDMATPLRPVYTLALTDPVWVRAYVQGPDLGKLRQGMRAEVGTDSFPGKRYRAWVGYISPTAEFTPKSVETTEVRSSLVYQVRIFVCNPQDELRQGMPATVTIPLGPDTTTDAATTAATDANRCGD
jgi:HlyD family secretion protein